MNNFFDICVIGGGHAGAESSHICSKMGMRVALISLPEVPIASAPCNPSIGGIGKGQVVREIDALGGLMGYLADISGIQFRTLNESKGYAVQSTRVQIDKYVYSSSATKLLESNENISIIPREVIGIRVLDVVENLGNFEVVVRDGQNIHSNALIITAGTFLGGVLHCGSEVNCGGRINSSSSSTIANLLSNLLSGKRFKTGTPPRIYSHSIDFTKMEVQPSDSSVINFSVLSEEHARTLPQMDCYLARTNANTMRIIRSNKHRSPMYNGQISGVGARYCPSIEDKAYRYPDKDIHHVFLEPEDMSKNTYYPSGISTSLPKDVQLDFVRSISGLENAEIAQYGYAVEYDVIDTHQLDNSLQVKSIPGLFFAGQVNGTSGYEEAAGQGLVAGINAALFVQKRDKLVLSRYESYIGIMIDDLVSSNRDEPYRLFTSRSENRLYLREDNAFIRLKPYRDLLNISCETFKVYDDYVSKLSIINEWIDTLSMDQEMGKLFGHTREITLLELLKDPSVDPVNALKIVLNHYNIALPNTVIRTAAIGAKYGGYIKKEIEKNKLVESLDKRVLILDKILQSSNISFECKQRISQFQPKTFSDLKRLSGIRPATLVVVASDNL